MESCLLCFLPQPLWGAWTRPWKWPKLVNVHWAEVSSVETNLLMLDVAVVTVCWICACVGEVRGEVQVMFHLSSALKGIKATYWRVPSSKHLQIKLLSLTKYDM